MKNSGKAVGVQAETGSEFAGHVLGYTLGSELRFELRNKKDKRRTCVLAASHPLFDVIAESVAHAHWADRKISVVGNAGEAGGLTIHTVQVGDAFKPEKVKPGKSKKEAASAANGAATPSQA